MTYPLTIYTNSLPKGFAGYAFGPLIFILKSHRNNAGLHAHELEHVKQWLNLSLLGLPAALLLLHLGLTEYSPIALLSTLFHGVLYQLSSRYRLWTEVQGYRVQNAHCPEDKSALFGHYVATMYGLNITAEDAAIKIRQL